MLIAYVKALLLLAVGAWCLAGALIAGVLAVTLSVCWLVDIVDMAARGGWRGDSF